MRRCLEAKRRNAIVMVGLALCSTAFEAAAQVPRIAPPPPCRVPATNDALLSVRAPSEPRRPVLVVFPFTQGVIERRHAHVPWTLAEDIRERLRGVAGLAVLSTGQTARATFETGGGVDSAMRVMGAAWAVRGELESEGLNTRINMRLEGTSGRIVLRGTYVLPRHSIAAVEDAIVSGVLKHLAPNAKIPPASGHLANPALDLELAGARVLIAQHSLRAADSAVTLLETIFTQDTSVTVANALARATVVAMERGSLVSGTPSLRRIDALTGFALAKDSSDAWAWTTRAMAARVRDPATLSGAEAAHQRAVRSPKRSADALHEYAVTLLQLGRVSEARSWLQRALALDAGRSESLAALAEVEHRVGRPEQVCGYANASISADPFNPAPYGVRAVARLSLLQTREAYADAETALQIEPSIWAKGVRLSVEAGSTNLDGARKMGRVLAQEVFSRPGILGVNDALSLARGFLASGLRTDAIRAVGRARPLGAVLRTGLSEPAFADILRDPAIQELLRLLPPARPSR